MVHIKQEFTIISAFGDFPLFCLLILLLTYKCPVLHMRPKILWSNVFNHVLSSVQNSHRLIRKSILEVCQEIAGLAYFASAIVEK